MRSDDDDAPDARRDVVGPIVGGDEKLPPHQWRRTSVACRSDQGAYAVIGRSSQVRATPAGARLFRDMTLDHADWIAGRLGAMSDADKTRLVDLLVRLRRILEAQPAEELAEE